ncbi:acyltransferase [Acetivibrio cellulolyticus]|uniref:acyltransferase n=1 Tax=Acetivibrio cellulolyticus TaxID=35830 RepID=UPI0001E304CB|nr:acyltransferase family protein [Acetivibrio cellulolyticus]
MSTEIAEIESTDEEMLKPEAVAKKSSRILYIDVLRVLSIFAVIIGHASSSIVANISSGKLESNQWWIANIFDSCIRWCIPVFFMISGVLLLNPARDESYGVFIKKRFVRLGIPFVIWSIFYSFAKHFLLEPDGSSLGSMPGICLKDVLSNTTYYHMWFMYTILAIYLFIPVMRAAIKKFSIGETKIYIFLWILIAVIYPTIESFYRLIYSGDLSISLLASSYLTGYLGYFVLGYYIGSVEMKKSLRMIFYMVGIASLVAIPMLVYISNLGNETLNEAFYSYFSLPVFLLSLAFFILFKQINWDKLLSNKLKNTVSLLSEASFGIYLVHMFIEDMWIDRMDIWKYTPVSVRILGVTLITFTLSYIFVRIVNSNKTLSKILFG